VNSLRARHARLSNPATRPPHSLILAGTDAAELEVANVTDNDPTAATPAEQEPTRARQDQPGDSGPEDLGYLAETGEAAGEDGSVVPIIGGLPAAEGSAWDIGAPRDERGAGLADDQGSPPGQASHEDTRSS
jgi:hypothetical protein